MQSPYIAPPGIHPADGRRFMECMRRAVTMTDNVPSLRRDLAGDIRNAEDYDRCPCGSFIAHLSVFLLCPNCADLEFAEQIRRAHAHDIQMAAAAVNRAAQAERSGFATRYQPWLR